MTRGYDEAMNICQEILIPILFPQGHWSWCVCEENEYGSTYQMYVHTKKMAFATPTMQIPIELKFIWFLVLLVIIFVDSPRLQPPGYLQKEN